MRRLTSLADGGEDADAVFAGLARELIATLGAEEVHVHHLARQDEDELVVVYMLEGDGQLSYLQPHSERPPGVSWVASTRAQLPRCRPARAGRKRPAPVGHRAAASRCGWLRAARCRWRSAARSRRS